MNRRKTLTLFVCPLAFCAVLLLFSPPTVHAQTGNPAVFAADSTELFDSFFRFHDDFSRWADKQKQDKAKGFETIDDDVARHLKIDRNEIPNLNGVTQSVMADLAKIDRDFQDYANRRAKYDLTPEPAMMQQFAARRQKAIQDGIDRLKKNLSPSGWVAIRDYTNNVHRLRFRRFPAPGSK